jgi:hypothetical protein
MRSLNQKYRKDAPHISVYFLKSSKKAGELNVTALQSMLDVHSLKDVLRSYGLVVDDYVPQNELIKKITANLYEHAKLYCEKMDSVKQKKESERLTLIGNLITQKVLAYLEMDRGYSEISFKLFDSYEYEDGESGEYSTNLVFDYRTLLDESLKLLRLSFDHDFSRFICGKIEEILPVEGDGDNEGAFKERLLPYKVNSQTFKKVAVIVQSQSAESDVFSHQALFADNERKFVENIAVALKTKPVDSVGDCNSAALVFTAANITDNILRGIENALSQIPEEAEARNLPEVFLFSVLPIPRDVANIAEELRYHIKNKKNEKTGKLNYPRLSRYCKDTNKLHIISYVTAKDLYHGEGNEIDPKTAGKVLYMIYNEPAIAGGIRPYEEAKKNAN